MNISQLKGKAQTVLGLIDPEDLGITLPHEHFFADGTVQGVYFIEPSATSDRLIAHQPLCLENLGWVRHHMKDNIDNLVLLTNTRFGIPEQVEDETDLMAGIRERTSKQVVVIVSFSGSEEMRRAREATKKFQEKRIPAFPSVERGARALRNALDYYGLKSSIGS